MKSIHLRFTNGNNLYDAIKKSAQKNRRSLNAEILRAIEFYLQSADEAKPSKEVARKSSPK